MKKKKYILCTKILWMNFSHRIENINKNKKKITVNISNYE